LFYQMYIWTSWGNHFWCLPKRQQKEVASFCRGWTPIWKVSEEETWITRWGTYNKSVA